MIYKPIALLHVQHKHLGNSTCSAILHVRTQMCINHDAQLEHTAVSPHTFAFLLPLTPTVRRAEVEAQQMKRQSKDTRHATEEQKPRGQIEVENGMKDLPSSDPRQQRPFEGLLHLHSA